MIHREAKTQNERAEEPDMFTGEKSEAILRLLLAMISGGILGYERSSKRIDAGFRTHIIVCMSSCAIMITNIHAYLFYGTGDPMRMPAQVISGVGFLGAGCILVTAHQRIKGVTTAAGIWATAAIGLAIGAGMYVIGLIGTAVIAVIQIIMHRFTIGTDSMMVGTISCRVTEQETFRKELDEYVTRNKMQILGTKVKFNDDGSETYQFTLRMHVDTTVNDLLHFLESVEGVRAISCEIEK